jgi:hypothetical protein
VGFMWWCGRNFQSTLTPASSFRRPMGLAYLVMTNSSPWKIDGPNRNRWLTELKNGWIFPWQTVSHNQMVTIFDLRSEQQIRMT